MTYPITGAFTSKKGITWNYTIFEDLTVEQYHSQLIRSAKGYKTGKDIYNPKCTKELKEHIKNKYNIEVK